MRQRNPNPGDRQRADQHRAKGVGDLFAQTAIVAHILLMVHRVNNRPCTQKQHRFEKRMREQMEHRDVIHAHACRHEHVPQLATGRIGDHPFDIVLHQANGRCKERRCRPRHHDQGFGIRRIFIKR